MLNLEFLVRQNLVFAFFSLSGCGAGVETPTQRLAIESGQFGFSGTAVVESVSFIRFDERNVRYDRSVSLLAQDWLNSNDPSASVFLQDFVGEASSQLAAALETEVRSRKCIYLITPNSESFLSLVRDDNRRRVETVGDRIREFATLQEYEYMDSLDGDAYISEYDRLVEKYSEGAPNANDELTEIAVASQCLLGIHVGHTVRVFKFDDLVAISKM